MYKWELPVFKAIITLDSEGVDEPATLKVRGESEGLLFFVHEKLDSAFGMFEHGFSYEGATPVDTEHALITNFDKIVWHQEKIKNYRPDIPEGAKT